MRTGSRGREISGIIAPFLLTLAAIAIALRTLNGVPDLVRSVAMGPTPVPAVLSERLEYPTIDAAEADLGVTVIAPRYFPSSLVWPPASIKGQREPARVVSLLFRAVDGQQALQIREITWPGTELPFPIPEPAEILGRQQEDVNGAPGELLMGRSPGSTPVNQLRWHADGLHVVVTTIYPPDELLRISRSIHVE